jgi:hypothetical protein
MKVNSNSRGMQNMDVTQIADEKTKEKIGRGRQIIKDLTNILKELPDADVGELLNNGELESLLKAILDPSTVKNTLLMESSSCRIK